MKAFLFLGLCLFLGCSTPTVTPQNIPLNSISYSRVNYKLLEKELFKFAPDAFIFTGDYRYGCPEKEWLSNFKLKYKDYKFESFDCEDFSLETVVKAREQNYGSLGGLTFGMVVVKQKNGNKHALNICRCSDGQWYFYEPQNGKAILAEEALKDEIERIEVIIL